MIGLLLNEESIALHYRDVAQVGVVNTNIARIPVMVGAANNDLQDHARQAGERVLTFEWQDGALRDVETATIWNVSCGFAIAASWQERHCGI